ncbi:MAG: sporulation peptidase YabG [Clostridia bacterium]|nr:sporulation peptidase YabG [Clostridia bacterium]
MANLKVGDIVARKSYGFDIFFKVVNIKNNGKENIVTLKGICYRIEADAPESDLVLQPDQRVNEHNARLNNVIDKKYRDIKISNSRGSIKKNFFRDTSKESAGKIAIPGRVLHLDGDDDYLDTCLSQYRKFGISAVGKYVPEKDQPSAVYRLLQEHRPDILVLTGHDGVVKSETDYLNLDNYRNSRYYIEAVKEARRYQRDMDSLIIFAGACQSMYNEIINSGANYASSPNRVLIHALDPVFICQKVAFTGIDKVIEPLEVINSTITGVEGIGGLQTRGKYREGYPAEPYNK